MLPTSMRNNALQFDLLMDFIRLMESRYVNDNYYATANEMNRLADCFYEQQEIYFAEKEVALQKDPSANIVPLHFDIYPNIWVEILKIDCKKPHQSQSNKSVKTLFLADSLMYDLNYIMNQDLIQQTTEEELMYNCLNRLEEFYSGE